MIWSIKDIDELLQKHIAYRESCLNLIASENYSSPTVRNYLTSDFGNRYGCYVTLKPEEREYRGNKFIHEFEIATQKLVGEVFKATYVDLRPIGGHMAGVATVLGLLSPGDLVFEIHLKDWGHGLVGPMRTVSHFNQTIRVDSIPFDEDRMVDLDNLLKMIHEQKPKMIIFGGSGMLFPEPIKEVKAIAQQEGIILAHDSSHVTGLIAGGVFPNPLDEGVDVMFGSTHKSFPGPQGGFIASRNLELFEKIGNTLASALVTSHHLNRLPALAVAMLEMKKFGRAYGEQVIKNSKALGKAMEECGFKVVGARKGYSETHLILVDVREFGGGKKVSLQLEEANILCSDDFGQLDNEIRIGTAEVTRRGMKEAEMKQIAELIKRVIIDKEDIAGVAKDVSNYARMYLGCEYSL
ncbi:serine hydroxymethyltransferase [Zhaonella formicivorans]|uniref:serine hydroxymethyltransferase n=1 Tax=Zhaonella formicivorans TaxID=2528593 RepID=UPI0010EA9B72|nr:aminotransferase class I/II-fold pyridoxal phosphate-dependent enzyme [Zhaonella formicivorans]